jgi:hypothetical protein
LPSRGTQLRRVRTIIRLPNTIGEDQIKADFEKGVLRIVVPKHAEAVKAEKNRNREGLSKSDATAITQRSRLSVITQTACRQ